MRLIDADKLKTTVECAWLTAQDKMQFCKLIDNAPTIEERSLEIARKSLELGRKVGKLEGKLERQQSAWIPVTERLPERDKEVIVTDIETIDTYQSRYVGNGYWECDNGTLKNRIIAWMPLPEPYEVGGEQDEQK